MATVTPALLGQRRAGLTGSPTVIFTVPEGQIYASRSIMYCNTSSDRRLIRACKVPSLAVFGEMRAIHWDAPVDPGWGVVDDSVHVFGAGASLQVSADVADAITVTVDGSVIT
jgi:hypothetical protein